jgi:hypothetical protein
MADDNLQDETVSSLSINPQSPVFEVEAIEGRLITESQTDALVDELSKGKYRKYKRFVMAALGSIPWIGSYLSILGAVAGLSAEFDQEKVNELLKLWLEEHQPKLEELKKTLGDITFRLNGLGEEIQERLESPEYLSLVRIAFRSWDEAETSEKREYVKRLISNAGATKLCPDDLVRLFISWIDIYHESHFLVIKEIFKNPGITRGRIWDNINNNSPRPLDNSSQAGLFSYLIRQLSVGGVIHQEKETNYAGQYLRSERTHYNKGSSSSVMESPFEDTKPYVLTELGKEFIHYVLNDVVQRVES